MKTSCPENKISPEKFSDDNHVKSWNIFCLKLRECNFIKNEPAQFDEFMDKSAKVSLNDFVIALDICQSNNLRFVQYMDAYAAGLGTPDAILYLKRREFLARAAYLGGVFSEERMLAVLAALDRRQENRVKEVQHNERINRAIAYGIIPSGYSNHAFPQLDDNPVDGGPALSGGTAG